MSSGQSAGGERVQRSLNDSSGRPVAVDRQDGDPQGDSPVSPIALPDSRIGWLLTRFADVTAALVNPR
jgi:hypothetical protein